MAKLSVLTWIGNAAAVLCGGRGAVSRQTQQAGCSRQTAYTHAPRVAQAVAEAQAGGPSRDELLRERDALRDENRQLGQVLEDAIDFPKAKQQQFVVQAAGLGLSDRQITALLALLFSGRRGPSRATVGRWVQTWAQRAGRLLQTLDRRCQELIVILCLDEIFCHRTPVLVGVEPHSLACVLARRAPDRSADTWHQALRPWSRVEQVIADAGSGLQAGLQQWQTERQQTEPQRGLDVGLDVFHTQREGQRVLRQVWAAAERVWEEAERHSRELARRQRQGRHPGTAPARLARAWTRAREALEKAERQERAWQRAAAALAVWRPDGHLNDRAWAEAEIAQALPDLAGPRWSKVRNYLQDPRSLNFVDRLQRGLQVAEPRADLRAALLRLWQLRQACRREDQRGAARGDLQATCTVQAVICAKLAADWPEAYRRVVRVVSRVVRASSVVECMNSVWRMHQARHRTLSQDLLDLKRLYWNSRAFAEGKRAGQCPYELLGLKLPSYDPWALLQMDPEELAQQVSTPKLAT